jgi:hypothetical protein
MIVEYWLCATVQFYPGTAYSLKSCVCLIKQYTKRLRHVYSHYDTPTHVSILRSSSGRKFSCANSLTTESFKYPYYGSKIFISLHIWVVLS